MFFYVFFLRTQDVLAEGVLDFYRVIWPSGLAEHGRSCIAIGYPCRT